MSGKVFLLKLLKVHACVNKSLSQFSDIQGTKLFSTPEIIQQLMIGKYGLSRSQSMHNCRMLPRDKQGKQIRFKMGFSQIQII
jgi:hypothetical protein